MVFSRNPDVRKSGQCYKKGSNLQLGRAGRAFMGCFGHRIVPPSTCWIWAMINLQCCNIRCMSFRVFFFSPEGRIPTGISRLLDIRASSMQAYLFWKRLVAPDYPRLLRSRSTTLGGKRSPGPKLWSHLSRTPKQNTHSSGRPKESLIVSPWKSAGST